MRDKIIISDLNEIAYIRILIENDIKNIEGNLQAKQKILQKFDDKVGK